jgi:hypothetical protein
MAASLSLRATTQEVYPTLFEFMSELTYLQAPKVALCIEQDQLQN